jgi:hypothetical protein
MIEPATPDATKSPLDLPQKFTEATSFQVRDLKWIPASDVRGEGTFLRVPEALLSCWQQP